MKVLYLDDDTYMVKLYGQLLNLKGHDVVGFEEAPLALKYLDCESPVDVIVSDVRMPGMDGLTFYSEVRKNNSNIPFIFLTGHGDYIELPSDAEYLAKPVAIDALLEAIDRRARPTC